MVGDIVGVFGVVGATDRGRIGLRVGEWGNAVGMCVGRLVRVGRFVLREENGAGVSTTVG